MKEQLILKASWNTLSGKTFPDYPVHQRDWDTIMVQLGFPKIKSYILEKNI